MELLLEEESYAVRGAVYEVYREKGCGFLEGVYQECLAKEFGFSNIPFVEQKPLDIFYKGEQLEQKYIPDFICYDSIIVELKAVKELTDQHKAQVLNYLKSTGLKVGLLINFSAYPKAIIERLVL